MFGHELNNFNIFPLPFFLVGSALMAACMLSGAKVCHVVSLVWSSVSVRTSGRCVSRRSGVGENLVGWSVKSAVVVVPSVLPCARVAQTLQLLGGWCGLTRSDLRGMCLG